MNHKGELLPEKKAAGLMDGSANQSFSDLKRLSRPSSSVVAQKRVAECEREAGHK